MATSFEDIFAALPDERRGRILKRAETLSDDEADLEAALEAEEAAERTLWSGPLAFDLYRDRLGAFRFRIAAGNGEPILDSPSFPDRDQALAALHRFRRSIIEATVPEGAKANV